MTAARMSKTERKTVLLVALLWKTHDRAPTWAEVRSRLGVDECRFSFLMRGLRTKGYVTFEDDVPGSLRVSHEAVQAALGKGRAV